MTNRVAGELIVPWLNDAMVWVVVAVAVLFQIGVILAVWSLSGDFRNVETPQAPKRNTSRSNAAPKADISAISEPTETFRRSPQDPVAHFYRQLWASIEAYADDNAARLSNGNGKHSQAAVANFLGIKAPDLSAMKLLAAGQRVPRNPARASVETLAKRFGLTVPK